MMDGLGVKLTVDNDVGLLEARLDVAQSELEIVGDVGALFELSLTVPRLVETGDWSG